MEKITYKLGKNLGLHIHGLDDVDPSYEFCPITDLTKPCQFRYKADRKILYLIKEVMYKSGIEPFPDVHQLLETKAPPESFGDSLEQMLIQGRTDFCTKDILACYLGIEPREEKEGRSIRRVYDHYKIDPILADLQHPNAELMRILFWTQHPFSKKEYNKLFESAKPPLVQQILNHGIRNACHSGHNSYIAPAFLPRIAKDQTLRDLVDPLLIQCALPYLVERDFFNATGKGFEEEDLPKRKEMAEEIMKQFGIKSLPKWVMIEGNLS